MFTRCTNGTSKQQKSNKNNNMNVAVFRSDHMKRWDRNRRREKRKKEEEIMTKPWRTTCRALPAVAPAVFVVADGINSISFYSHDEFMYATIIARAAALIVFSFILHRSPFRHCLVLGSIFFLCFFSPPSSPRHSISSYKNVSHYFALAP